MRAYLKLYLYSFWCISVKIQFSKLEIQQLEMFHSLLFFVFTSGLDIVKLTGLLFFPSQGLRMLIEES